MKTQFTFMSWVASMHTNPLGSVLARVCTINNSGPTCDKPFHSLSTHTNVYTHTHIHVCTHI